MEIVELVQQAVAKHLPENAIDSVVDRGVWVKHIFEVTLDNGHTVLVKLNVHPEWGELTHEIAVERLFRENGIPAPHTLAADMTCEILPYQYLLQEKLGGSRLDQLLEQASSVERAAIYQTVGELYRKMHSIHNDRSGLWNENPGEILYEISPNDYMYQAEMISGSGKAALESGLVTQKVYERAIHLWAQNMPYLKKHLPTLVHGSPFVWTIYLDKIEGQWAVTKLMALGDILWWDAAYDLAFLLYPPFATIGSEERAAFQCGYGELPEMKRILLYAVMQRFCAAMGVYMEPPMPGNVAWRHRCLDDLEIFLDEIERLS